MSSSSSSSYRCYNQDVSNKTHLTTTKVWFIHYMRRITRYEEDDLKVLPVVVMDGTSGVVSNNSFGDKHLKSEFTFIKSKVKIYDRILLVDNLKMEMEMEIPSTRNVK
ncbi:hypothetical protein Tco_1474271 [Tanacetum coccineum]